MGTPRMIRRASGLWAPPLLGFGRGYPCCLGCTGPQPPPIICDECDDSLTPEFVQVELFDFSDSICDECDELINGVHILESITPCGWRKTINNVCTNQTIIIHLQLSFGFLQLTVDLLQGDGPPNTAFHVAYRPAAGRDTDCLNWDGLPLEHFGLTSGSGCFAGFDPTDALLTTI